MTRRGIAASGAVSGMYGPMMAPRLFGAKEAGSMVGFINIGTSVGAMFGPALAGFAYSATNSYSIALLAMAILMGVSAVLMLWVGSKRTAARVQAQISAEAATASGSQD
jgi:MFS family permease